MPDADQPVAPAAAPKPADATKAAQLKAELRALEGEAKPAKDEDKSIEDYIERLRARQVANVTGTYAATDE